MSIYYALLHVQARFLCADVITEDPPCEHICTGIPIQTIANSKPETFGSTQRLQHRIEKANTMTKERPATMADMDHRDNYAWFYSFSAAMVPFTAFCLAHSRGMTVRAVEAVVKSPVGVYGLLALPFVTLGMEKSIYDTVQAWQGLDPTVRPADRGGFPSGGAGRSRRTSGVGVQTIISENSVFVQSIHHTELPSFSLIPVQRRRRDSSEA